MNLGNPQEFTILELAELVIELTAGTAPITFRPLPADDPVQRCPDISLARASSAGNHASHSVKVSNARSNTSIVCSSPEIPSRRRAARSAEPRYAKHTAASGVARDAPRRTHSTGGRCKALNES